MENRGALTVVIKRDFKHAYMNPGQAKSHCPQGVLTSRKPELSAQPWFDPFEPDHPQRWGYLLLHLQGMQPTYTLFTSITLFRQIEAT